MSKHTVDGAVSSGNRPASFASVKLPVALVQQAREAAQPLRRSVAGQIEYWTTLGRVVEHSGLTAQEAQTAIVGYEQQRIARASPAHSATLKSASQRLTLPEFWQIGYVMWY